MWTCYRLMAVMSNSYVQLYDLMLMQDVTVPYHANNVH